MDKVINASQKNGSVPSIRGMRDLFGLEYDKFDYIIQIAKDWARRYGYTGLRTPILEYTRLFQRTLGDTSDIVGKEMYTFSDRNEESLTLRPEGTASAVRALLFNKLMTSLPQKVFYEGAMFRYERPQKGRYREFYQFGVECFLKETLPEADAECIALASSILNSFPISPPTLHLSTLGDNESRFSYREALVAYLTPYKDELSKESQVRLLRNPLRILDSKNEQDQKICESAPKLHNFLTDTSKRFFEHVKEKLSLLDMPFKEDNCLVRGLDYYSHTVFEFKTASLGAQDTILAGGRYDSLIEQLGGPVLSGIGFSLGVDRLSLLMDKWTPLKELKIFILPIEEAEEADCFVLTHKLRAQGFLAEFIITPTSIGKRLKIAARLGGDIAIFIGETERLNGSVRLKDLKTSEMDQNSKEKELPQEQLFLYLKVFKEKKMSR